MKGTFECTVMETRLAETGENETPSVKITLHKEKNILTGEKMDGMSYYDAWLTEKAFENSVRTLSNVFDWNGVDFQEFETSKFVGMKCWAVCVDEEYKGEILEKVKFLNKLGGGSTIRMDPARAKALSERLKGKMLAYRQEQKTANNKSGF